ncbi:peroxisome assembly protein 12 [Chrysoperla carnea]|uniref:peroxisome assembly protein 12 n=1 Tax=Chrysoperla carnea TaxID=189513 RepID=UPI001D061395|nr:peroxisome assembly protein 12 [Chrysoperla carnea]
MAVSATHRTANLQQAPSIFEVIAQDSLRSSIYPALKKLIEVLSSKSKYSSLQLWYDEIFLVLNGLLQFHYLKYEDASFSEAFYGLQRISADNRSLSMKQKLLCMIPLVLLPYLRIKLENIALKYKLEDFDGLLQNDRNSEMKRQIYQIEPAIPLVWQFLKLVQYLSYISGNSAYSSPELSLLRLKLVRNDSQRDTFTWTELWKNVFNTKSWSSDTSLKLLSQILFRSIEVGAFFMQFLQWWYTENTVTDYTSISVPEAPTNDSKAQQFKGVCPICLQRWKIPTILPTSGYVFCYRCIVRHLTIVPKCPITNYPTSLDELVRLYDE